MPAARPPGHPGCQPLIPPRPAALTRATQAQELCRQNPAEGFSFRRESVIPVSVRNPSTGTAKALFPVTDIHIRGPRETN